MHWVGEFLPDLWICGPSKLWASSCVHERSSDFSFSCWSYSINTVYPLQSGKMPPIGFKFHSLCPAPVWWLISHCAPVLVPGGCWRCTWYILTLMVRDRIAVWTSIPGIWNQTPWCHLESVTEGIGVLGCSINQKLDVYIPRFFLWCSIVVPPNEASPF